MNLKNNLFNYATSELSQDAFLCWLASYALEDAEPDDALRSCAREMLELFVPELKGRPFTLTDVERQVWHIDALLETDLSRGFYSENTRNYNTATRTTAICHILYRLVYTACKNIHYFLLIIIIANLIE